MDLHKNYDQAKKEVAKRHGYESWAHLLADQMVWKSHDPFHEEAAELYAQWVANEAVKADRIEIMADIDQYTYCTEYGSVLADVDKIRSKPLPFPQQPDGI